MVINMEDYKSRHRDNMLNIEKLTKEPKRDLLSLLANTDSDEIVDEIVDNLTRENKESNIDDKASYIYATLTNPDKLKDILSKLLSYEYNELLYICQNGGLVMQNDFKKPKYYALISLGLTYVYNFDDKIYVVIPNELVKPIMNADVIDKIKENTKIMDLSWSLVNYYGFINIDLFYNACMGYYGYKNRDEIKLDNLIYPDSSHRVSRYEYKDSVYLTDGNLLYSDNDMFSLNHAIDNSIYSLPDYPYKKLNLDELLKYKDFYYYEEYAKEIDNLTNYLKKLGIKDINKMIKLITSSIRISYDEGIKKLPSILAIEDIDIKELDISELLGVVNSLSNILPIWGNKGWSYKEILTMEEN